MKEKEKKNEAGLEKEKNERSREKLTSGKPVKNGRNRVTGVEKETSGEIAKEVNTWGVKEL